MSIQFIDLKTNYQRIKPKLDQLFSQVLENTAFIYGPVHQQCEEKLAEYTQSKHCIAYASGSDALLAAMMALGLKEGDEVITTNFSFFATVGMMKYCGVKPVLVDIDPTDYNLDLSKIEAAITPRTRAIMPVSLYGQMPDMGKIIQIARNHKLYVIEDGAQSFGATYKGQKSCSMADISCTSFYPAKPLGCFGDGGACFTNDAALAQELKTIREHGSREKYNHERIGFNGRLDALQCAVVLAKMDFFEEECELRSQIGSLYTKLFIEEGLAHLQPPKVHAHGRHVYAQYTLRVPQRENVQSKLKGLGIPTAVHYPKTISEQEAFIKTWGKQGPFPVSEKCSAEVMSLPMHPYLKESEIKTVVSSIKTIL